jgi:hypothetical protein
MTQDLIIRVKYNDTIYDLDVLNEVPLRIDMSTVETQELGRIFGIGSQQFSLPGTKKNNRFFKNGYDIGADNTPGMYNSIDAWVIQNGETLLYGELQVVDIITDEDGYVNYNVQISDKVVQFKEALKGLNLRDGDWSAYDHTLSSGSILDSWNDNLLSGDVFYPLGAFGRDDDNQGFGTYPVIGYEDGDIGSALIPLKARQFLPAVRMKDVLDVIFDQVGFRYTGSFVDTDDFNNLYMLTKADDSFGPNAAEASATFQANQFTTQTVPLSATRYVTASVEISDPQNAYDTATSQYTAQASGDHTLNASVTFFNNTVGYGSDPANAGKLTLELRAGSVGSYTVVTTEEVFFDRTDPTSITLTATGEASMTGGIDKFFAVVTFEQVAGSDTLPSLNITPASLSCTLAPAVYEAVAIDMADQFNAELKSEDIIKGLITQFNLVMIPDQNDQSTIQIETFDNWVRAGELKDWTSKYDTSKRVSIQHTISDLPKLVTLQNAEDSDRFSVLSKEQEPYRQYGSLQLYAESNNAVGQADLTTVFAPVVLASVFQTGSNYPNINLASSTALPHIYKYDNDKVKAYAFKPRLGYKVTNTLPSGSNIYLGQAGVGNYEVISGSYSTISNISQLPAISGSSNDLHFNNTYGDFAPITLGINDGVTAYETYWKTYYQSLYWDEAKKVTLDLQFDPYEYKDVKLNDRIMIKNQYYRINKIKGFNVSQRDTVTVELVRLYPAYFQL